MKWFISTAKIKAIIWCERFQQNGAACKARGQRYSGTLCKKRKDNIN